MLCIVAIIGYWFLNVKKNEGEKGYSVWRLRFSFDVTSAIENKAAMNKSWMPAYVWKVSGKNVSSENPNAILLFLIYQ